MAIKKLSEKAIRNRIILKWIFYVLILIFCQIILTNPSGSMIKPLFIVPVVVCISMREAELSSALIGVFGGLLIDFQTNILTGFNAIIICVLCVGISLLFLHLMRPNIVNFVAVTAIVILVQQSLDFLFAYAIWKKDDVSSIFLDTHLVCIIGTTIVAVPIYFLITYINNKLGKPSQPVIEEKNPVIDRT